MSVRASLVDLSRVAARLIVAAVIACAFGALTQWSVPHLPYALEPLANTAAPWVLVAFLLALSGGRVGESVLLAVVALIALTLGFYAAQALRGWAVSRQQVVFWSISSLVFGPMVGSAAGWLRYSGATAGSLGAGMLGGLIAGEAVHGLVDLTYSPVEYWHVQLIVGAGLAIVLTGWSLRRRPGAVVLAVPVAAIAFALAGLGTLVAYQVS